MPRSIVICLFGLAAALMVVGAVSGTVIRHLIQIMPIVFVAAVLFRFPAVGASGAIPIFGFWIVIVSLIWLFLAGLSSFANGTYTPIEVAMTVAMAGFSAAGIVASVKRFGAVRPATRALIGLTFAVVQVGAMWVSFMPRFANR